MLTTLPMKRIVPDPHNARKHFDEGKLRELAASILERGLQQPVKVRPIDDGRVFQIVMGERRWRAHKIAGLTEILAFIENQSEHEATLNGLIENLQRAELTPMEEARAFQTELDKGLTPEDLARALGFSQAWRVTYRTRLLDLDDRYQKLLDTGSLTLNAAQEIAKLDSAGQTTVIQLINQGRVRNDMQVTAAVDGILQGLNQSEMFKDAAKTADKDLETVGRMEDQIARVKNMVSRGWRDGECVIAAKVARHRAGKMADEIALIARHLQQMEKQLRQAGVQVDLVLTR